MSNAFAFDVFLSHNRNDKPRVLRLAERLRAAGLRVWYDDWAVKPGDQIFLAVENGLQAARVLVLCLSPHALGSGWVGLERATVMFRDPGNAGRRFIPVLLADCDLPDTLRGYKYVDYRTETDTAFGELLSACGGGEARRVEERHARPEETGDARPGLLERRPSSRRKGGPPATPRTEEEKARAPDGAGSGQDRTPPKPLPVLERTLLGHQDWVKSVAVSPDGSWAVSGSFDTTLKIWDLNSGKCQATLEGHTRLSILCRYHTRWKEDSFRFRRQYGSTLGCREWARGGELGSKQKHCAVDCRTTRWTTRHLHRCRWRSGPQTLGFRNIAMPRNVCGPHSCGNLGRVDGRRRPRRVRVLRQHAARLEPQNRQMHRNAGGTLQIFTFRPDYPRRPVCGFRLR